MSFQPMARLAFGCHVMKPSMQATCNGLTSITPTVAGILARYRGVIFLNGLLSVPVQVATRLAKHRGPLYLGSIEEITEEARKALHENPNVHYRDRESYEDSVDMPDLDGM